MHSPFPALSNPHSPTSRGYSSWQPQIYSQSAQSIPGDIIEKHILMQYRCALNAHIHRTSHKTKIRIVRCNQRPCSLTLEGGACSLFRMGSREASSVRSVPFHVPKTRNRLLYDPVAMASPWPFMQQSNLSKIESFSYRSQSYINGGGGMMRGEDCAAASHFMGRFNLIRGREGYQVHRFIGLNSRQKR